MTKVHAVFNDYPTNVTLERLHGTQVFRLFLRTEGATFQLTFSEKQLAGFLEQLNNAAAELAHEIQKP